MFTFFKMSCRSMRHKTVKFLRNYIKNKHNNMGDVCAVWAKDNVVYWETSHTRGILSPHTQLEFSIRKLVGQNILHLFGIPQSEEDIPVIYLVVFPSVIKLTSWKKFFSIIKQWPGASIAAKVEVVKYRLFLRRG